MNSKALRSQARAIQMDATSVKTQFGSLGQKLAHADIEITKHGTVEAVVVAPDRYHFLVERAGADVDAIQRLEAEYEAMIARMQSPAFDAAVENLGQISGAELSAVLDDYYDRNPVPPMAAVAAPAAKPPASRAKAAAVIRTVRTQASTLQRHAGTGAVLTATVGQWREGLNKDALTVHSKSGRITGKTMTQAADSVRDSTSGRFSSKPTKARS